MKRFLKISGYFFLTIFGLILLVLLFTQTGWFSSIVKDKVETIANENINGKLSIGEIDGSFIGSIELHDLRIDQNGTTVFYTKKIDVDYDLLGLLSSTIEVNSAIIDSFYVYLNQVNDSTWNLSSLIKETEEDTTSSNLGWDIVINSFEINNSRMDIETIDSSSSIPEVINNINLKASASISSEEKKVELDKFSFETLKPNLKLFNMQFIAVQSDQNIRLEEFNLQTEKNKLTAHGNYSLNKSEASEIFLETETINLSELKKIFPDLDINGSPELQLEGQYLNSTADIKMKMTEENQKVNISAQLENIDTKPAYNLSADIYNINAAHWLSDTSLTTDVNGTIEIRGTGFSLENVDATAEIKFSNLNLLKRELESLNIFATVNKGDIKSIIELNSNFGELDGNLTIGDISGKQKFDIKVDIKNFNIAPILLNDSLQSDINLTLQGNGSNLSPQEMTANFSITADTTSFMAYRIDSLNTSLRINSGSYNVERFRLSSEIAELNAQGTLSQSDSSRLLFSIKPKKLSAIPQLDKYESLNADGEINGDITGNIDSISVVLNYSFENLAFQTNTAENLSGSAKIVKVKDSIDASIDTKFSNLKSKDNSLDGLSIKAHYFDNKINSDLLVTLNDTASAEIKSIVLLDSLTKILISKISLNLSDNIWQNPSDTIIVTLDITKYKVEDFVLQNKDQKISLNGILAPNDSSNIELVLKEINIGEFLDLLNDGARIQATVDGKIVLEGNLSHPTVNGNFQASGIVYKDYSIGNLSTDFKLMNEKLNWDFELNKSGNKIVSEGFIPIIFNADSNQSIIPGDRELSLNLKIDSLDMGEIAKFTNQFDEVKGTIKSDIRLKNSLNNLQAAGFFTIDNAKVESDYYGISYENINLNFKADSTEKKLYLDEFTINNDDETLEVDGFLGYDNGLLSGSFDPLQVTLTANEFELAQNDNYEAKIDGEINFRNEGGDAKFGGQMTLIRSRIYLPYFTESGGKELDESKPLLIKEMSKTTNDSLGKAAENIKDDTTHSRKFFKEITGRFTLSIPKNTWVVSPQMNIELSGDLDVVKSANQFELYGNVSVKRGRVEVYGKEFEVAEGKIIFNGGEKLNPEIAMTLQYTIRGSNRSKQTLQISVHGTAEDPNLAFSLDGSEISEGDAISYIAFGKSMGQLTQGERTNVENRNQSIARTIAGNFLAAQVSSSLGDALGLDVIEIQGDEDWRRGTLTAGKYITDDLYVSYERGFGSTEANEVSPRIVTAEYELTKFLFLQLVEGNDKSAGFDVIFKFNWD